MGADYKPGVGLVDRHGEPLSTEAIVASMRKHGVAPPGFLSQRPRSPGAAASVLPELLPKRASLYSKPRSGAATLAGTYDSSYGALTEQLLFSGSKLDAAKSFDKMIRQFGSKVSSKVKTLHDAWEALADPERYGWGGPPPGVKMRPVRTAPLRAAAEEIQKAQAHQGLDSAILDTGSPRPQRRSPGNCSRPRRKTAPVPTSTFPRPPTKSCKGSSRGRAPQRRPARSSASCSRVPVYHGRSEPIHDKREGQRDGSPVPAAGESVPLSGLPTGLTVNS